MANIGSFKRVGKEYQGEIFTLQVQTKGIRIVPEEDRANEDAPTHRVFAGRVELGAGWTRKSASDRPYLSVKLDDPSFSQPIYASLFDDEGSDTATLIWSRPRASNND